MKKWMLFLGVLCAFGLIVGCEWESVSDDVSGSSGGGGTSTNTGGGTSGGGTSTNTGGGSTGGGTGGTGGTTNTVGENETAVLGETLVGGGGVAGQTSYSGYLAHPNVVPGSVTIVAGGFVFTDNGDKTLSGTAGTVGAIEYTTGAWSINLNGADIDAGAPILGYYVYMTAATP